MEIKEIKNILFINGDVEYTEVENLKEKSRNFFEEIKKSISDRGYSLNNCVKTIVSIDRLENYFYFNEIYNQYLGDIKPARTYYQNNSKNKVLLELLFIK